MTLSPIFLNSAFPRSDSGSRVGILGDGGAFRYALGAYAFTTEIV